MAINPHLVLPINNCENLINLEFPHIFIIEAILIYGTKEIEKKLFGRRNLPAF
jgi:hypothetical protein